jgi:tRNA 2-thiouridine synthesizing protein A
MHFNIFLDLKGKSCPVPLMLTKKELRKMEIGMTIKIIFDDKNTKNDLERFCSKNELSLHYIESINSPYIVLIKKY